MTKDIRRWLEDCRSFVSDRTALESDPHYQRQYVTAVREHLGIGMRELARRIGVSGSYLCHVENGNCRATFELNARLAKLLETD